MNPKFLIATIICLSAFRPLIAAEPVANPPRPEVVPPTSSETAPTPAPVVPPPVTTDPGYRLAVGDAISVVVQGEPELTANQVLGRAGEIRLVYAGDFSLAGKTVREAETALETLYRDRKLLKQPVIRVSVSGYAKREVWVTGAVRSPGPVPFTGDSMTMDVVDAINKAGGFVNISKADAVKITRRLPDGKEGPTQTVDLENVISGRFRPGRDRGDITVSPGDRIFVPERIF